MIVHIQWTCVTRLRELTITYGHAMPSSATRGHIGDRITPFIGAAQGIGVPISRGSPPIPMRV